MIPAINPVWLKPADLIQAKNVQQTLAEKVIVEDDFGDVTLLAGVDVSNAPRDPNALVYAAIALMKAEGFDPVAEASVAGPPAFPYVPGFLGFREAPWLIEAFRQLPQMPDLIFVDGHGRSHPRGLGIASHLGVLLDRPTIGVAKSILVGKPAGPLGPNPGDRTELVWRDKVIGMVLRTKMRCNPLYISSGHRISLESALRWVMHCLKGYRLPEPTRRAHLAANVSRRAGLQESLF